MRLGIDLGGTKIEILALNDKGEELLRKRVATPKDNYPATLQSIRDLVLSAEAELRRKWHRWYWYAWLTVTGKRPVAQLQFHLAE